MPGFGSNPFLNGGTCYADQASFSQAIIDAALVSYPVPPNSYSSLVIGVYPSGPNAGKPYYHIDGHLGASPTVTNMYGLWLNTCNVPVPVVLPLSPAGVSLTSGGSWPAAVPPSSSSVLNASAKTAISGGYDTIKDTFGDLTGSLYPYDLILAGIILAPFVVSRIIKVFSK